MVRLEKNVFQITFLWYWACSLRLLSESKSFWQTLQLYCFVTGGPELDAQFDRLSSPFTEFKFIFLFGPCSSSTWYCRARRVSNSLSQCWQMRVSSSIWRRMCAFKLANLENFFPHSGHWLREPWSAEWSLKFFCNQVFVSYLFKHFVNQNWMELPQH